MRSSSVYLAHPALVPGPGDLGREPEDRPTPEEIEEARESGLWSPCWDCGRDPSRCSSGQRRRCAEVC